MPARTPHVRERHHRRYRDGIWVKWLELEQGNDAETQRKPVRWYRLESRRTSGIACTARSKLAHLIEKFGDFVVSSLSRRS